MKASLTLINKQMDKENVVYGHNGIFPVTKKDKLVALLQKMYLESIMLCTSFPIIECSYYISQKHTK